MLHSPDPSTANLAHKPTISFFFVQRSSLFPSSYLLNRQNKLCKSATNGELPPSVIRRQCCHLPPLQSFTPNPISSFSGHHSSPSTQPLAAQLPEVEPAAARCQKLHPSSPKFPLLLPNSIPPPIPFLLPSYIQMRALRNRRPSAGSTSKRLRPT